MSNIVNRIMSLADPHITAAFQDICGIKVQTDVKVKSETNGVVNSNGHGNTGSGSPLKQNGSCCENGNTSKNNGNVKNGYTSRFDDISHKQEDYGENGLKKRVPTHKNGYTQPMENGHSRTPNGLTADLKTSDKLHSENGEINSNVHTTTPCDTRPYTINNYFLYYIFSFGASLGNEVFYILFFSTSLWNFDNFVTRRMLIYWGVVMYIGQALKDVIRMPRPLSPPAIRLETRYVLEYGMPSTHATVGMTIPFGMLIFATDSGRYELNLLFGVLFCINWSILVSFSRLYLGMHSALDILAGVVFAIMMMAGLYPFVDELDRFLISHPYGGPVLTVVTFFCCYMYPTLDRWSTARGDTTISVSVFAGIYTGLWMTRMLTNVVAVPEQLPYPLAFPPNSHLWSSIQRCAVGVTGIVIILNSMRFIMLRLICFAWGLDHKDPKSKQTLRVELPYKFIAYFTPSLCTTFLMPILFNYLDIVRPAYYSEIFKP